MSKNLKEVREGAMQLYGRRLFQVDKRTSVEIICGGPPGIFKGQHRNLCGWNRENKEEVNRR